MNVNLVRERERESDLGFGRLVVAKCVTKRFYVRKKISVRLVV